MSALVPHRCRWAWAPHFVKTLHADGAEVARLTGFWVLCRQCRRPHPGMHPQASA